MATDFSSQLLRNVILDQSFSPDDQGFQGFTLRRDDVNVLAAIFDSRSAMLTPAQIRFIENLRTSDQAIDLQVYNKKALGVGTSRVRRGSGSPDVNRVLPTFFDVIEEGIDMSLVNQAIRQYGSEGEDKKEVIRRAYTDHLAFTLKETLKNIYTRVNAQFVTWLDANIWALNTTPDAGDQYTTYLANAKQIPNTDNLQFLQKMNVEAEQNNFLQAGRPMHIASMSTKKNYQDYAANSGQQAIYVNQFVDWFDAYLSNTVLNGAGVESTIYQIYRGGVAAYNRVFDYTSHPDSENGVVTAGIDKWFAPIMIGQGTPIMPELPPMKIELKATCEYTDNSGTLTIDESNIDIVNTWSFVTQWGALRSYDPVADISPIMKYELLA